MLNYIVFFAILFLSGFASLINQVVWQRAIKVYLGGAEAICSMIVVFVFMLGLGLGSLIISKKTSKLKNPFFVLTSLELFLFITNLIVLYALKIDISASIFTFQKAAIAMGLPIKVLYSILGVLLLIVPCSIMGMTMPVASEAAKRQLNFKNPCLLDNMFFINTMGSCLGALLTGFKLIPFYGQTVCLVLAAVMNLIASLLNYILGNKLAAPTENHENTTKEEFKKEGNRELFHLKEEEIATFFIGFVSLGYEMYLYKTLPLVFQPLPHIFSAILCLYLLFWSIGVSIASLLSKEKINYFIFFCGVIILLSPYIIHSHRLVSTDFGAYAANAYYCCPPLLFGILFGQLLNKQLSNWGADVGRFMGLNTLGSCLGILLTTMIGGYMFYPFNAYIFASILFSLSLWLALKQSKFANIKKYCGHVLFIATSLATIFLAIEGGIQPYPYENIICYSDPAGITEITNSGNMIWDGIWHSRLSNGRNHIGSNNWLHAIIPILCVPEKTIEKALVIGMGVGVTVGSLAKCSNIKQVRTYDINKSIDYILRDFATGTLNIRNNPKVEIIWQDARSGLFLDETQYDLISQQPLYLKQAGSSNLLSEEYLRIVHKRLSDNGVFLVYANSLGNNAQKLLVRKTLQNVFPHCLSFLKGYLYVVSKKPIVFTEESIKNKFENKDNELIEEIKSKFTIEKVLAMKDIDNDDWKSCPISITDDYPALEYPKELTEMSKSWIKK